MDFQTPGAWDSLRAGIRELCSEFGDTYWQELDYDRAYPLEFVQALGQAGWLSTLIPTEYNGGGLGLVETSIVLEEINRSGGNANAAHAQVYLMAVLLRHASETLKRTYLPQITAGKLRLQAFAVTEQNAGSETTRIETTAVRNGDKYIINGSKIFISRVEQSDLMLILARTTAYDQVADKTTGLSLFLTDLRRSKEQMKVHPMRVSMNNQTNRIEFFDLEVPVDHMIGEEGNGFRCVIDSWNSERILIASECIGDGRWFIDRAVRRANERVVFDKPIGANQGVQFPIASAYAHIEAADLIRLKAATKFDTGDPCGPEANMAKLLASESSWEAANVCLDTYGGYGFLAEYDVERKFRETRLYTVAPVTNNLVLAYLGHRVLGLPRSY